MVVHFRLNMKADDASVTFVVKNNGVVDPYDDASAVASIVRGAISSGTDAPFLAGNMLVGNGLNDVTCFLHSSPTEYEEGIAAGLLAGTLTNSGDLDLIQSGALLVQKKTALSGRRGSGRMFVPFISMAEPSVDPRGIIAGGSVTLLQTRYTKMLDNLTAAGVPMYLGHDTVGSTLVPTIVTALVVRSRIATQRRRLN